MSLSIHPAAEADLDIANEIVTAAFNSPRSRKAELQRYLHLQPDGWQLVRIDDAFVGFGGLVEYGPFSYLGMMSVLPSAQGRGVGKALMRHLIAWNDARGCPTILLDATPAGAPLYAQFNFVEDSKKVMWERDPALPLPELLSQQFSSLSSLRTSDMPALVAFDAQYFGVKRASVISSYWEDFAQRALLVRDEHGAITGYLIASMQNLGPWVAGTGEAAEQLLRHALQLPFDGKVNVSAPVDNQDAQKLLAYYGFSQKGVLSHMRYGNPATFRDLSHIYGQASSALG